MTSAYLQASRSTRRSPNYTPGRSAKVSGITIHWWDSPTNSPTFAGAVNTLCDPAREVSAHFVVEAGRMACLVHPDDKAWHAISGNTTTIGIECNPRASQEDRDVLVGLIVALWLNYGKVALYPHHHWVATACPGVYYSTYWTRITNDANRLYDSIITDTDQPNRRRITYRNPWWNAIRGGSGSSGSIPGGSSGVSSAAVSVDGYWGSGTTRALQQIMGTPIDGVVSSQDAYWKSRNPGLTSGWEWVADAQGSALIQALQKLWGVSGADGLIGPNTIKAMQRFYGTVQDGVLDEESSAIMAMQRWINTKVGSNTGGNVNPAPAPGGGGSLTVDGYWGADTIRALQKKYGTPVDGVVSSQDVYWKSQNPGLTGGWEWVSDGQGSQLIIKLQKVWGVTPADGLIGPGTIKAMQRYYGVPQTGTLAEGAPAIKKMQAELNKSGGSNSSGNKPKPNPATPDSDPLLKWVKVTEAQCFKGMDGAFDSLKPYKSFTGTFILEWLRKPEYWGKAASGMWVAYTPELSSPAELQSARLLCAGVCGKQPKIKGKLPRRDVAHMAATALGYLTWGIEETPSKYGLGDLGGWPLDLLQIWGTYRNEAQGEDLASWLRSNLGSVDDGKRFGYEDVLADADAWLIARYMKKHPSGTALSNAMRDVFKDSETNRIKRFYRERFAANATNVVKAFQTVADGIDAGGIENVLTSDMLLKRASGADRLPTRQEAEILARSYAHFLMNPHH